MTLVDNLYWNDAKLKLSAVGTQMYIVSLVKLRTGPKQISYDKMIIRKCVNYIAFLCF